MQAIKFELESVAETADIAVRADVARALAALAVVEREVEKLDGQTATVDIDVSGGARRPSPRWACSMRR